MSLVPYGGSDVSDSEEDEDENVTYAVKPVAPVSNNLKNNQTETNVIENEIGVNNNPLFNLPEPKHPSLFETEEEDDEFLRKKEQPTNEKKPVKISIPSLSQFKETEEFEESKLRKFRAPSAKSTGLFSVLPPPKGSGKVTSLLPSKLNRPQASSQKPLVPHPFKKPAETKIQENRNENLHTIEDEIDDDTSLDFFSLDKKEEHFELPEIAVQSVSQSIVANPTVQEPTVGPAKPTEEEYIAFNNTTSSEVQFDETAIRALAGSRGKRKLEATEIMEVHEHDIRLDNKKWLERAILQGTGDEDSTTPTEVAGGILKRKHQITYLAQQAKANEQQLKNMWAQNKAKRQQTQSKYGF